MATCNVNGKVVWGSTKGLTLKGEGCVEQLDPLAHGFIVQGESVSQCVAVRPGTNSVLF
mgnify:CR=1 FL=1